MDSFHTDAQVRPRGKPRFYSMRADQLRRHAARILASRTKVLFFVALCVCAVAAQSQPLSVPDALSKPEAEVEARLFESHPTVLYAYAKRLFEAGRKDDAVMWFYAGQLRFRFRLKAGPSPSPDGEPALMASLNATIGQTINEWAGGSPKDWSAAIFRALEWDAKSDNPVTSKDQNAAALAQLRNGLEGLAKQIMSSEDMIRAQRKSRGLENR